MADPPDLLIRLARRDEHELVHRLMLDGFATTRAFPIPSSALADTRDDLDRAVVGGAALLAFQDGRAVASARIVPKWSAGPEFDRAAALDRAARGGHLDDSPGGVLHVSRMSVLPEVRNRGIGAALLDWVETVARNLGLEAVELNVRSQQPDNRPFYQRLGYRITGYSGRYGIPDMSTHMRKKLS